MSTDPYTLLEERIRTGEYRPGVWLAPERRLAEEFGVNRGTIRRVIARLADAGLVRCEPGRRPVVRGPEAPTGHPATVALLMGNEPLYHAFQEVLHGCEPVLRAEGYRLLFFDTWSATVEAGRRCEREALESLLEHPVSGVILWSQHPSEIAPLASRLREQGTPIVALDRITVGLDADFVGIDNMDAAARAVNHLLALGHRRIAFATNREEASTVVDRETGYRQALADSDIPVDASLIERFSYEGEVEAVRGVQALLSLPDPPTAFFAVNDILALRLVHALEQVGRRIPDDIAIVGFDDLESFSYSRIGLTSIHQSYRTMGRQAARLVCRRIQDPSTPLQHVLMETRLVARRSTVPAADPLTALAGPMSSVAGRP